MQRTAQHLNNSHIVFATRNFAEWMKSTEVHHYDLWLQNKAAQAHKITLTKPGDDWWVRHTGCKEPFTSLNAGNATGVVTCSRAGEKFNRSEFKLRTLRSLHPCPSELTLRSNKQPITHPLPLIDVGRDWNDRPEGPSPLLTNRICCRPPETWRILGREKLGKYETVKVEIPEGNTFPFPLKRHEGKLEITPLFICWFNITPDHTILKSEDSVRFGYSGKEYVIERVGEATPNYRYEVSELGTLQDGIVYPIAGKQEANRPVQTTTWDPDIFLDEILSSGKAIVSDKYELSTRDEWRVLKFERISSGTQPWLEPPVDCFVIDEEKLEVYIAGVSDSESRRRLGMTPFRAMDLWIHKTLTGVKPRTYTHRPSQDQFLLRFLLPFILSLITIGSVCYYGLHRWRRKGRRGLHVPQSSSKKSEITALASQQ
ncbi:MAG: hypothetical protein KDA68_00445 [Planctomycetaceae bacterium]|nr:hypothetical protein [Planctomycetaceae bacterium]